MNKVHEVLRRLGEVKGAWKLSAAIIIAMFVVSPHNSRGLNEVGESDEFIEQYEQVEQVEEDTTTTATDDEDTTTTTTITTELTGNN